MSPRSNRRAQQRRLEREAKRRTLPARRIGVAGAAAVGGTVLFAPNAQAATFTVTSLADNGTDGTLRKEIYDANTAPGDDTIQFQAALSGSITLTNANGDILITNEGLDIQGPGADEITVSGNHTSRIFDLYGFNTNTSVSISGLTLTDGVASANGNDGGAIRNRFIGAIPADLVIDDTVITGNYAQGSGAAISSNGVSGGTGGNDLTVTDSVLSGNYARNDGGAVVADGTDTLIERTTLSGNTARYGDGGGLYFADANGAGTGATVQVRRSTISDNYAGDRGGGAITAFRWNAPLVIENSTLSGNEGRTRGGAVYLYSERDQPTLIRNTTITDNTAGTTGGGVYRYAYDNPGEGDQDNVTISSSIVANNTAPDGDLGDQQTGGGSAPSGNFILGFSLIEDDGGVTKSESTVGSNIFNDDPELLALSDAGGPTETQVPSSTSPVLDAAVANSLTVDQRGLTRPVDLAVANAAGSDATDMGAVERQVSETTHTVIDTGPEPYATITDTTPTFTFSSPNASPTFECSLDQGTPAFSACNSGTFTPAALGDGTYTFRVRATSSAVTDPTPATRTFTVDANAPETTIDTGPTDGSTIGDDEAVFTFHSDEPPPGGFECSLEMGAPNFGPCTSSFGGGGLADGTWTFMVRAVDEAGNPDGSPASRTFTVDTTNPQTTIESGPADGETISDPTPTFGFASSEPNSTFECSLTAGATSFGPCSGPGATHTPSAPLADGTYTFRVRATDPPGNVDSSPISRTFTVNTAVVVETGQCQGATVTKTSGSDGNDQLTGGAEADLILGLAGNDRLLGADGDDCLTGGEGNDKLSGQAGKDNLNGEDDDDKVTGGSGKDKLKGAGGDDVLKAADGAADKVNCGPGKNDEAVVDKKDKVSASCEDVTEK